MGEFNKPKENLSEGEDLTESIEPKENSNFEVIEVDHAKGPSYIIYFNTEENAAQAVKDFWLTYSDGRMKSNFDSGMFKPTEHAITKGPRTQPIEHLSQSEQEKHPGKNFAIHFNGNTGALQPEAIEILRGLGYI